MCPMWAHEHFMRDDEVEFGWRRLKSLYFVAQNHASLSNSTSSKGLHQIVSKIYVTCNYTNFKPRVALHVALSFSKINQYEKENRLAKSHA